MALMHHLNNQILRIIKLSHVIYTLYLILFKFTTVKSEKLKIINDKKY